MARAWWHLQGEISRSRRGVDIEELLNPVFEWQQAGTRFEIATTIHITSSAA